jgi:predicted protein tyrosine phosphatase
MFNFENIKPDIKDYILSISDNYNSLNFKSLSDFNFYSIKTDNIELVIGQEEFISLSLLAKKEDLINFNVISIIDDLEDPLPFELYSSFNNFLVLDFFDIRTDLDILYNKNKLSKEELFSFKLKEFNHILYLNLKKFILQNKNKKFIIHCGAGISRSSAVAIILEDILSNPDANNAISSFQRYSPNKIILNKYFSFFKNYKASTL